MKNMLPVLIITGVLAVGIGFDVSAKVEISVEENISPEELLFMEIPEVFASSKRMQPVTEAASSVEIVTAEDIRQSGATNIADVLRSVPGIDVRETSASQHVIGIRGFCDTGHVLVTLNGNNVFMYHANHIFLDWIPVGLEEIDRIEIIKGPGAIFYGGNAFSGVINIVTKTPLQLEGSQINLVGGDYHTVRSNFIHARSVGDVDFSISGGYRGAKEYEAPKIEQEKKYYHVAYVAGKATYHLDEESSLTGAARYSEAKNVVSRVCNPDTTFVSLRYDRPDFWARAFYNNHQKNFWDKTYEVKDTNYEIECMQILRWGENTTALGGYAKKTAWKVEALEGDQAGNSEKHDVEDYALNLENEYRFSDRLFLVLGGRAEYYSLENWLGLGRGSIIYKPAEDQNIRFTIANGYYIPSLFQQTNDGTAYPFALGNRDLKEEKILSYELAYYASITRTIKLSAAIFYNEYRDLIDNTQSGPAENVANAYQHGGEVGLRFLITDWLTGFANYAYQHIHRTDFGDLPVDPRNKVNCGLLALWDRWSANVLFNYVDHYYEIYLTANPVFGRIADGPSLVKSYTTVDIRIGYDICADLELYTAVSNLFNDVHYESNSTGWLTSDRIGRLITAGVSYKF